MRLSFETRHAQHIRVDNFQAVYDVRGTRILRYTVDASCPFLTLHRNLSAADVYGLELKLAALVASWDDKIDARIAGNQAKSDRASAESLVQDAESLRQQFGTILRATLTRDDRVVWDRLKSRDRYAKAPFPGQRPLEPRREVPYVAPELERVGLIAALFGGRKKALARYEARRTEFEANQARTLQKNAAEEARFVSQMEKHRADAAAWEAAEQAKAAAHAEVQRDQHRTVDALEAAWRAGDSAAILEHAALVLDASDYGGLFQPDFELDWVEASRTLVVDYRLPVPDAVPRLKTAKLVASTGEVKQTFIPDRQHAEIYDLACYQICLRTLHELFEADEPEHLQAIVFNGIADYVDRAVGRPVQATILSVAVQRAAFQAIDLSGVEPKTCFRALKGVSAASLASLVAVAPVLRLDRTDKRFVDAREIDLDAAGETNLAVMPWQDFEHLIRQVFGQVFSARGGEVKVTQASRDGGVDAIAFDPDPIGGGKIVIQAKRYTRTVGVAAVRDLYGTVMNEGANKGILVTTADYGPDAYAFAAGKPLTLLSGANLLHLLGQHGVQARIDFSEAPETGAVSRP
jgi:restriction system protein